MTKSSRRHLAAKEKSHFKGGMHQHDHKNGKIDSDRKKSRIKIRQLLCFKDQGFNSDKEENATRRCLFAPDDSHRNVKTGVTSERTVHLESLQNDIRSGCLQLHIPTTVVNSTKNSDDGVNTKDQVSVASDVNANDILCNISEENAFPDNASTCGVETADLYSKEAISPGVLYCRTDSQSTLSPLSPSFPTLDINGFSYQLTYPSKPIVNVGDGQPPLQNSVLAHPVILEPKYKRKLSIQEVIAPPVDISTAKLTHQSKQELERKLSIGSLNLRSPSGRYIKLENEIGRGSFKTVYEALDCEIGVGVAWCELSDKGWNKEESKRFREEVDIIKGLKHPNILRFYDSWEYSGPKNKKIIVMVTELMTSGTLKHYIKRFRRISDKLIANWCRQILKGLVFLHTRAPPVIHRDLKCDNIFINGQSGQVKIGDLGLATLMRQTYAKTVIGTPEFMAPEMYEEHYDEKIDIYAFGMCMLEMATSAYPYKECRSPAQIYRKVTSGIKPESYNKLKNESIKVIIDRCIKANPKDRLSAQELLEMDFFNEWAVHLDCLTTGNPDVLRIKLKDDIRNRQDQHKEDEIVQFDFHLKKDSVEKMVKELVKAGYLNDGNVKVASKLLQERITLHQSATSSGVNSENNNNLSLTSGSVQANSAPVPSMVLMKESKIPSSRSHDTKRSEQSLIKNHSPGNQTNHTNSSERSLSPPTSHVKNCSPSREHSACKGNRSVNKRPVVLIHDIEKEEGALMVNCELQMEKITVNFKFNGENSTAEEITNNLRVYLKDTKDEAIAQEQIRYIIDLVNTHKDQPEVAKQICEQLHHIHDKQDSSRRSSFDGIQNLRRAVSHELPVPDGNESTTTRGDDSLTNLPQLDIARSRSATWCNTTACDTQYTDVNSNTVPKLPSLTSKRALHKQPSSNQSFQERSTSLAGKKIISQTVPSLNSGDDLNINPNPHGVSASSSAISYPAYLSSLVLNNSQQNLLSSLGHQSNAKNSSQNINQSTTQGTSPISTEQTNPRQKAGRLTVQIPLNRRKFSLQPPSEEKGATDDEYCSLKVGEASKNQQLRRGAFNLLELSRSIENIMHPKADVSGSGLPQHVLSHFQVSQSLNSAPQDWRKYLLQQRASDFLKSNRTTANVDLAAPASSSNQTVSSFSTHLNEKKPVTGPGSKASGLSTNVVVPTKTIGRFAVGVVNEGSCNSTASVGTTEGKSAIDVSDRSHNSSEDLSLEDSSLTNDTDFNSLLTRQSEERKHLEEKQKSELEKYMQLKKMHKFYYENCHKCKNIMRDLHHNHLALCDFHTLAFRIREISNNATLSKQISPKSLSLHLATSEPQLNITHEDVNYVQEYLRSSSYEPDEISPVGGRRQRHNSVEQVLFRLLSEESIKSPTSPRTCNDDELSYPELTDYDAIYSRVKAIRDELNESRKCVLNGLKTRCNSFNKQPTVTPQQYRIYRALEDSKNRVLNSLMTIEKSELHT